MAARLSLFLLVLGLLTAATVAFNLHRDPYRLYQPPAEQQPDRTDLFFHLRLHKPYRLEQVAPRALVMGSSVSGRLLPSLVFPDRNPVYNAAIPGASMLETHQLVEHALQSGPVTDLLLGLEYFMFAANYQQQLQGFETDRLRRDNPGPATRARFLWQRLRDCWSTLLSRTAIADSLRLRQHQATSNRAFWPDGSWDLARETLPPRAYYKMLARQKLQEFSRPDQGLDFTALEQIFELARRHGVRLSLFLSPYHSYILSAIQQSGHYSAYGDWHRGVVQLAEAYSVPVLALGNSPRLVNAPIDGRPDSLLDGVHPRRALGRQISRCLALGLRELDCREGWQLSRLDSANIEQYLERLEALRRDYVESEPAVMDDITRLARGLAEGADNGATGLQRAPR